MQGFHEEEALIIHQAPHRNRASTFCVISAIHGEPLGLPSCCAGLGVTFEQTSDLRPSATVELTEIRQPAILLRRPSTHVKRQNTLASFIAGHSIRPPLDFIEEDRAAMRDVQQARLCLPGVRERTAFEAEQLGLEQCLGDRRAVDFDEGRRRTRTVCMNERGDQPFASSRLAFDENRQGAVDPLPGARAGA
jgi:hypothetical protein